MYECVERQDWAIFLHVGRNTQQLYDAMCVLSGKDELIAIDGIGPPERHIKETVLDRAWGI